MSILEEVMLMSAIMPTKEFLYLKDRFHDLDSYIINIAYNGNDVSLDFANHKIDAFVIEYRSLVLRTGLKGQETYNETGVHLNAIFENYLKDELQAEKNESISSR
jgi:hypothetical protein